MVVIRPPLNMLRLLLFPRRKIMHEMYSAEFSRLVIGDVVPEIFEFSG